MKFTPSANVIDDLINRRTTHIITGYDGVIHKAKSSGNINNHDTAYLLKVLRDYLMCIYRALEEIEV